MHAAINWSVHRVCSSYGGILSPAHLQRKLLEKKVLCLAAGVFDLGSDASSYALGLMC